MLDFVRASARALLPRPPAADTAALWRQWADRLAEYVGDAYPLAQRVGAAAGAAMNAAHDPMRAYEFGLERVLAALADLQSTSATDQAPALTGPNAAPDGSAGTPSATR